MLFGSCFRATDISIFADEEFVDGFLVARRLRRKSARRRQRRGEIISPTLSWGRRLQGSHVTFDDGQVARGLSRHPPSSVEKFTGCASRCPAERQVVSVKSNWAGRQRLLTRPGSSAGQTSKPCGLTGEEARSTGLAPPFESIRGKVGRCDCAENQVQNGCGENKTVATARFARFVSRVALAIGGLAHHAADTVVEVPRRLDELQKNAADGVPAGRARIMDRRTGPKRPRGRASCRVKAPHPQHRDFC